jgi:hypothetical protein
MIKARPKYPTDLYGTFYIDNIQKAVVICLIIPTIFPFDAGSSINKYPEFIENFIMAEIFQPSDKIKLIFILY